MNFSEQPRLESGSLKREIDPRYSVYVKDEWWLVDYDEWRITDDFKVWVVPRYLSWLSYDVQFLILQSVIWLLDPEVAVSEEDISDSLWALQDNRHKDLWKRFYNEQRKRWIISPQ